MKDQLKHLKSRMGRGLISLSTRVLEGAVKHARVRSERRFAKGHPRALWGVTPIVTLPIKARCTELIGFKSDSLVFETYHVHRKFDWNLELLTKILARIDPRLCEVLGRLTLAAAIMRYDVFHYFNDRGILPPTNGYGIVSEELDVLRRAGKRLYVFTYGGDVRTRERTLALGRWNFCTDCPKPGAFCVCDETSGREQMALTSRTATAVVTMGDMIAYAPAAENFHYWPIDTDALTEVGVNEHPGPLMIAHAPNHTHFKGTAYLVSAIDRLKAEGLPIELVCVQGVPNRDVLKLMGEADIVADQFIGGAYGYTALEGMARGKPVLCYIRNTDMVMAQDECPLIQCDPETIEQVLRWCVTNRNLLAAIGRQGRRYVEKYHSLPAVSARFAELYRETGDFPSPLAQRFDAAIAAEKNRLASFSLSNDWRHPFRVADLAITGKNPPKQI